MIVAIILTAVIVIAIKKSSGWESIEITKCNNEQKYEGTSWCSCGAGVKHDNCI
jgi:hypothetical protein